MPTITISPTGRMTIPAAMRRQLGIVPGTYLHVEERADGIFLRPVNIKDSQAQTKAASER
jgi:AbrB family looped-hinge helix DNA binding protein